MDAPGESAQGLNLSPEEKRLFGQLFRQADTENIGVVTGEVAVKFFEKTRLDPHVLGEIWQIADTENRGLLTPYGFGKVLRLIGHYQAGRTPTPELAFRPGPLPKFDGGAPGSTTIQPPPGPPPLTAMQPQLSGQGIRVPPLTPDKVAQYTGLFEKSGGAQNGLLAGEQARAIFERAGLPNEILGRIWALADVEQRGALNVTEFIIAMHLLASLKSRTMPGLPTLLPPGLFEAASRRPPTRQLTGQPTGGMGPIPRQMSGAGSRASPLGGSPYGIPPQITGQITGQMTGGNWAISPQDKARFDTIFAGLDKANRGVITGEEAVPFFTESKLPEDILAQIWDLADINSEGHLNSDEFAVAMYLIRQQRGKQTGRDTLPPTLPSNLVPPSMRNQFRPPTQPTAPDFDTTAPTMQKSAADDLFGLDALSSPVLTPAAPTQTSVATGGSSGHFGAPSDPFGNSRSPIPTSPVNNSSPQQANFKPFLPSSSFGQSLNYQTTGNSSASAQQNRGPTPQPSAMEDLLGDNDPAVSAKLTSETTELANLSNQISTLSTQMQEVQGQRAATQTEVLQSSSQKRQFEERLASLRTLYEKEVKDVRGLQESLRVSRDEIQKLQREMAILDGTYKDLQTQRQQVTTQLQSDQQENANLKERMKAVNAEVAQLKPQLEKLRLEARQQKGLVAINKKQLATNEGEREKVKTEIDDLTKSNQETARAIAETNSRVSSPAPMGSPTPSTNNPFFRRQQSIDATPAANYTQSSVGERSFDSIFGPAIIAPEKLEKLPTESGEARAATPISVQKTGGDQVASRPETASSSEPPPPPESRQINSSFLPFPHPKRTDSLGSSQPTSKFGEEGSTGTQTPTSSSVQAAPTIGVPMEAHQGPSPAFDRNMTASPAASEALPTTNSSIPGAFPNSAAPTPSGEPSLGTAEMFPSLDKEDRTPTATKNDFDAAFAGFKTGPSKVQERQNTGGSSSSSAKPKEFASEFPPMAELENNDDSDSASEGGGFEDDFTSLSPKHARKASSGLEPKASQPIADPPAENAQVSPPSYEKSQGNVPPPSDVHKFDGLLPPREIPTTTTNPTDDIFGGPLPTSQSPFSQSPFGSTAGPTTTTTQVPQPPAKVPFDVFDDEFDGLEDAKEGEADDLGDSILEHSTLSDFNPMFDSPSAASKTSNHGTTDSGVFGRDANFNNAFAEFNTSQSGANASSIAPPPPQDNHDWDAIFSGLDKAPAESKALSPTNGNGNNHGLGNGNGIGEMVSPTSESNTSDRPPLGRALTEAGEHDDPILKNLTGMGYARKDALAALEKYDYNLERAANYLASES